MKLLRIMGSLHSLCRAQRSPISIEDDTIQGIELIRMTSAHGLWGFTQSQIRKILWSTYKEASLEYFCRTNSHVGIQVSCLLERSQQCNREPPVTNTVTLTSFWGPKHCLAQGNSRVSKESPCNAGDPSLIPGSRRSAGEEIGSPLQYSWGSLVAQLVKNLPTMSKTWVWSLGWEDPLEKETATHSSILAWRIPWTHTVHGVAKSWTWLSDFHFQVIY